ncbi:MAG: pyridoxal phosphate-dependent aminotransferase [Bdellovibrionales bacterium]|nr:pyridoxal phosphate-dependent aminotransferase [Bdellovibrionales bacterium]
MLSQRVKNLKASPTLALAAKAKELKAAGKDVISLSVGEPDWDTFESIKAAGIKAIQEGQTKYTPASGTPELRKAIAIQTEKEVGIKYSESEVTVSTGGKFVIFSALQSTIDPGDEVLIPAPYWVSYPDMVELAGGVPKIVQTSPENRFKMTTKELESCLSSKTKMLIINSPSNPTGEIYSLAELKSIVEVLKKYPRVIVMSDDIYNRLVFTSEGIAPHLLHVEPSFKSRTLIINGVSKTYSMTGWRLGWALGPSEVISAMNRYQSQSASCASSITQAAAFQALTGSQEELSVALKKLKVRRDFVFTELQKVSGFQVTEPQGAFYIWPNISSFFGKSFNGLKINGSKDFANALLEDQMVVTVPGVEFGQDICLRLSYALEESRMQEAIERIQRFTEKVHG